MPRHPPKVGDLLNIEGPVWGLEMNGLYIRSLQGIHIYLGQKGPPGNAYSLFFSPLGGIFCIAVSNDIFGDDVIDLADHETRGDAKYAIETYGFCIHIVSKADEAVG